MKRKIDRNRRADSPPYYCSETSLSTTADVAIQQTFAFDDSEEQFIVSIRGDEDPSHDWGASPDVSLAAWLERPIMAGTYLWEVGEPFPVIYFNPWSHFLDSPSVAQKLSNFYLLRCKMHMKIIVNGSAMHYGRGFVSYRPLLTEPGERYQHIPDANNPYGTVGHDADSSVVVSDGEEATIMVQSQWPKIFIDPGQSMGGEMEFPFFFGSNWFRIPNKDWVATPSYCEPSTLGATTVALNGAATPDKCYGPYGAGKTHMGVVHSSSLAPLKHSNGALDPVTIQVFLWASDVEMSVPTSAPHPDASPLEGFVPRGRTEYVPDFLGDLAKPGSDITDRLEFGSSSLNTAPATAGLADQGEMAISAIAQRECWLDRFTWAVDDPAETLMWQAKVTPQYYRAQFPFDAGIVTATPSLIPTPCAYSALPFGYWRGSMKYRIQIVASNLHRGRIRIVYDPYADLLATPNVNAYPEDLMNLQYSRTIDIGGDCGRDFTFEVGYMQSTPYLPLLPLPRTAEFLADSRYNNFGVPVPGVEQRQPSTSTNGGLSIFVLNRLAVPSTAAGLNNDVQINVFVSAGSDMSFQMPTSSALDCISFMDPTGFPPNFRNDAIPAYIGNMGARRTLKEDKFVPKMDSASMGATTDENVPTDPPPMAEFGDVHQVAAPMAAVTFGESFTSWDNLMSRWTLYNREMYCDTDYDIPGNLDNGGSYVHITINPDFPPYPGPAPLAKVWLDLTDDPFSNTGTPRVPTLEDGFHATGVSYNFPPPSKVILNAPVDTPEPNEVDCANLLRVNPGRLTMLHFVTRMFVGRKGSLKNKYVLDGNRSLSGDAGTQVLSVKRLSDSGVIDGRGYLTSTLNAVSNSLSNAVTHYFPASGGLWDQASAKIGVAEIFDDNTGSIRRLQNINGYGATGALPSVAPNWCNETEYPLGSFGPLSGNLSSDLLLSNFFDGAHVSTAKQQPVLEVEIPFYMNTRFLLNELVLNNTTAVSAHAVRYEDANRASRPNQETACYVERYTVPGSDFALFYLANVPQILLNHTHVYPTQVLDPVGVVKNILVPYPDLKYLAGARQPISAYRATGLPGGGAFNTIPCRTYYYDLPAAAIGAEMLSVPGNLNQN